MAQLQLQRLRKSFGATPILHGIDLDIPDGEFVVVLGPSGCGKSTLLRLIAGLDHPDAGDIAIGGRSVVGLDPAHRGVAMVFQNYALYPHMTVRENLAFGLENLKTPAQEIERRVALAAQMLQLDTLLHRLPKELSGGQRQRVAIGRATTREPGLFLFDEPLSNLDAELRATMRSELTQLHRSLGNTMLYVTHDQVEAMTMADRIVLLRAGKLEQQGAPLTLYNRPANRFVAGFLGLPRMNFIDGCMQSDGVFSADGLPPLALTELTQPAGTRLALGVRPSDWELADQGWPAEVLHVEEHGTESVLRARLLGGQEVLVQRPGQRAAQRGDGLHLRPRVWHAFDDDGRRLGP
ncbi:MAG: ABC transporter ATP-binding protein [Burkholderiales bacterium]|nr:ABC transporter ATP-binding protein [Burkholderiales bacterium]